MGGVTLHVVQSQFVPSGKLDWSEVQNGARIGLHRQLVSIKRGSASGHGYDGVDAWKIHIEGAIGEVALSKGLNRYWPGSVNTYKTPDLQGRIQVRSTLYRQGCLIVRPDDDPGDTYVLVTLELGETPRYWLPGWMTGTEARKLGEWKSVNDRPHAWFVPQSALHDVNDLL
jgi:hypothetical protein